MLYARFDGNGGLTSHEVAAALAGRKDPSPLLVSWFQEVLDRDLSYTYEGVLPHLPEHLKEHLSHEFQCGKRSALIDIGGGVDELSIFGFTESPAYYESVA